VNAARRIIPRDELMPAMRREPVDPDFPQRRCRHTIELDGYTYRCGRADHEGIHDAFASHVDQGAVRW